MSLRTLEMPNQSFPPAGLRRPTDLQEPASPFRRVFLSAYRLYCSRQFLSFVFFGGTAAAVNLAVGWLLYSGYFGINTPYELGVVIGASSGLFVNFALNYKFTFKFHGRSAIAQLRSFVGVSAIGIVLTEVIASELHKMSMDFTSGLPVSREFAAHVCAVGLVTFYSFAAHHYLTFNVGFRARLAQLFLRRFR